MKFANAEILNDETLDPVEWDTFMAGNGGHFMQSSSWGSFKLRTGWGTRHFAVRTANGEIAGGALLLSKRIPILNRQIFYLPRGPVVYENNLGICRELFRKILRFARKEKGIFLRIDPYLEESSDWDAALRGIGFMKLVYKWSSWNCPRYVLWLDLRGGEQAVFQSLTSKVRYKVRIPYKKGVAFREGGYRDLNNFCELMTETAEKKRINVREADYYKELYETLSKEGMAQIFCSDFNGLTIASAISIKYGKRAWLLYAGSTDEYSHLRANRTLQWEMIKWAIREKCDYYDFRGTATDDPPNPKDPGYGVYKFKNSFGPEYIRMIGYYDYVFSNIYYKLFTMNEKFLFPFLPGLLRYVPQPVRKGIN